MDLQQDEHEMTEEEAQELSVKKKGFMQRWSEGIQMITPLQQLESTQKGNWVMLVGLVAGIIVMAFKIKQYWWIEIILAAGLFNQALTMIGIWQKIKIIKKLEMGE